MTCPSIPGRGLRVALTMPVAPMMANIGLANIGLAILGLAFLLVPVPSAVAQTPGLQVAVDSAVARADTLGEDALPEAGSWLAGLPSVMVAYYDSTEDQGTDEAEVILNLPFKSPARRRLDAGFEALDGGLAGASEAHRRWVYSGLVRERAWDHQLAVLRLAAAEEKRTLLETLSARIQRLAERGAVPVYQGLIVERERLAAELEAATLASERDAARAAWATLTGTGDVPGDLSEPGSAPDAPDYAAHPALLLLDRRNDQQQQLLALDAPQNADWNLGLVARDFDGPGFDDRQFGLSVELPLGFPGIQNTGNLSARRAVSRDYLLERDRLSLALRSEWEALRAEAELLQRRRQLLGEAVALADRIEGQLERLDATNEVESELLLQRLLDVLDTRAEASLTDALIGRNQARLRQAAGRSL
jgi:hypothetical protein